MNNTKIIDIEKFVHKLKQDYDLMISNYPQDGHYLIQEYENRLIGALNILNYLGIMEYYYIELLYVKYRMWGEQQWQKKNSMN